jgi:hypothetical protein
MGRVGKKSSDILLVLLDRTPPHLSRMSEDSASICSGSLCLLYSERGVQHQDIRKENRKTGKEFGVICSIYIP